LNDLFKTADSFRNETLYCITVLLGDSLGQFSLLDQNRTTYLLLQYIIICTN